MNQSIRRYKKRMLILCIMLAVVIMTTGISYAIFTNYTSQNDANTLAASCIDLEFNGQNEINLLNTYPISEGEALEQTPYTFTIKNNCDNYIEYYVIASVISTTNKIDSKYVKVSLLGDNDLNGTVINTLESISTPQSLSEYNITENYILKRDDGITKDESRTFNFRMWLDSNNKDIWTSEEVENKDYEVKISVVGKVRTRPKDDLFVAALIDGEESTSFPTTNAYKATVECTKNGKKLDANESIKWNGTKWVLTSSITDGNVRCNATFISVAPAPDGWYIAENGTLLANLRDNNELKTPLSTPGAEASLDNESLLASADDDYGTSYYFRGAVKNNYVQFANKCWHIVRVTGDGSIKLVLHNDNTANASNPCSSSNNSDDAAFARYNDDVSPYYCQFNNNYGDNAYVGFMYGTPSASDYTNTHKNLNKSDILTSLETYFKESFASYTDKLADTIWCNDKGVVTDTSFDPWSLSPGSNFGYGTNINYYDAFKRLVSSEMSAGGTGPSLICQNDINGGKIFKFTVDDTTNGNGNLTYKIGLLTVDETVFAGAILYAEDSSSYLQENTGGHLWWTLSSHSFDGNTARVWGSYEGAITSSEVSHNYALRPAISLVSNIKISGGTGTSEDPYVVN